MAFIDILIFDAIIGNSDRHQGNWGFIHKRNVAEDMREPQRKIKAVLKRLSPKIFLRKEDTSHDTMSPIYDSGCCLGREFSEDEILLRLKNQDRFDKYIKGSRAELRRDDMPRKKVSHFQLLQYIMSVNKEYSDHIKERIDEVSSIYNNNDIKNVVYNIDSKLPEKVRMRCKMSDERKEFIYKVIDRRIKLLSELSVDVSEN